MLFRSLRGSFPGSSAYRRLAPPATHRRPCGALFPDHPRTGGSRLRLPTVAPAGLSFSLVRLPEARASGYPLSPLRGSFPGSSAYRRLAPPATHCRPCGAIFLNHRPTGGSRLRLPTAAPAGLVSCANKDATTRAKGLLWIFPCPVPAPRTVGKMDACRPGGARCPLLALSSPGGVPTPEAMA